MLVRNSQPDRTTRYHLGPDTEHEVYEAEIIGVQLALHLLSEERGVGKVDIYVDNQAVVRTLMGKETDNMTQLFIQLERQLRTIKR